MRKMEERWYTYQEIEGSDISLVKERKKGSLETGDEKGTGGRRVK